MCERPKATHMLLEQKYYNNIKPVDVLNKLIKAPGVVLKYIPYTQGFIYYTFHINRGARFKPFFIHMFDIYAFDRFNRVRVRPELRVNLSIP